MKKIILISCIFLYFINIVSAVPLGVQIANTSLNMTKEVIKSITLNVTNNNNFIIYDISATGDIVYNSPTIISLAPNSSVSMNINLKINEVGDFNKTIKVISFTKVTCNISSQQEYAINITLGGTNPRNLEICKNDNVKFFNNYGTSVFIDITNYGVYQGIANQGTYIQNYPDLGSISYKIEPLIDLGYVLVKDIESKVHYDSDDGILNLKINSFFEDTSLTATYNKLFFNMSYDTVESSYLTIKNIGNKTAENIVLYGEWFNFDKNNFNLNAGEEKAVNFAVSPLITSSEESNKTYVKTIFIRGANFKELSQNFTVFVKQAFLVGGNISTPEWWVRRLAFCNAYPNSPDCLTEPYYVYRDKIVYDAPEILMNMSPAKVKEYMDMYNLFKGEVEGYMNNWKTDTDTMKNGITEFRDIANRSLYESQVNKKEFDTFKNMFYILEGTTVFLFMIVIIGVAVFFYYKNRKLKSEDTV